MYSDRDNTRHSKDFVRTVGSAKATDTTTRLVWRHGKGTTRSACAGTDDSAVLGVRFFIIVVNVMIITKSLTKCFHIESGSVACWEKRASNSCIGQSEIECDDVVQFLSASHNNIMSNVLCWMIPFLLFPLTASLTFNPTNYNESILRPRLLPQNAPYLGRGTNSSALNNISNITSGSEKFIWIIEDTYNASNFFQWVPQFVVRTPIQRASLIRSFSFFTGEDPTQYVLFYICLTRVDPFPVEPSSMRLFTSHSIGSW
jgi:hypothetical protein